MDEGIGRSRRTGLARACILSPLPFPFPSPLPPFISSHLSYSSPDRSLVIVIVLIVVVIVVVILSLSSLVARFLAALVAIVSISFQMPECSNAQIRSACRNV